MCSAFLTNHSEANYFFFIAKTQEKSGRTGKRFAAGPWGAHPFCRHKTARHKRHNACDELFYIMGKLSTHSFCRLRVLFAQQSPLRWAPVWLGSGPGHLSLFWQGRTGRSRCDSTCSALCPLAVKSCRNAPASH